MASEVDQLAAKASFPPSKVYMLATDSQGRAILSVHIKRTYQISPNGQCVRTDDLPLLLGNPEAEDDDDFNETDILPFKQRIDLIVMAKAWGKGQRQITAGIRTPNHQVSYRVSGDRRVSYHGKGTWTFGQPEPFDSIEMRYENAYGGFDPSTALPPVVHIQDILAPDPGVYPRNPVGKGYAVVEGSQLDGLLLPNIENPEDTLTPQRLVSGTPSNWWRQPLPWSCNWFPKFWYPRLSQFGAIPSGLPQDDRQVPEVRLGYLDAGHVQRIQNSTLESEVDARFGDAASPALILPPTTPIAAIELTGLSPEGRMVVRIPPDRPRVYLRHLGRSVELPTTPHRVLVSMLEMGVYVVWHAAWPLPDGFFDSKSRRA